MRKTFVNKTLAAVLVSATFTTVAFGDILTSEERSQYAEWNSSYDTFQVGRSSGSAEIYAYELFNLAADHYSATGHYNNAADFYAERAVKSLVSDWTVSEGSQIVGMFRSTGFAHSLNLTNSTGTVWNTTAGQAQLADNQGTWINSLDSSRNIDVGAVGTVNMTLTGSWKTNAANNDPVWADGLSYADKEYFRTTYDGTWGDYSATVYGDQPELNGGLISMVAYDVTDLLKAILTFARYLPRHQASGQTKLPSGSILIVSNGTGHERGKAPRLRFFCRPDFWVINLEPEK